MQVKIVRLDDDVVRVSEQTASVAELDAVNDDHHLVTDRRPIQDHLWSIAPVGDAEDQARILGVDSDAVEAAGGAVAGTTGGDVVVGTLPVGTGRVQLVGSLLPAANQSNRHSFGISPPPRRSRTPRDDQRAVRRTGPGGRRRRAPPDRPRRRGHVTGDPG